MLRAKIRAGLALGGVLALWGFPAIALSPAKVVVTIKPLHALVSQVMAGVGVPTLLVKGLASAHTYALRPSEVRQLNDADIFVRMSETTEPFTGRIVRSLPDTVDVVTLQEAPHLTLLSRRTQPTFDRHQHGQPDDSDHEHGQGPSAAYAVDGHAWLDPDNAVAMVDSIQEVSVWSPGWTGGSW